MSLPSVSARRPVAVAMFFLAVAMVGAISLGRLPIDLLPDIAYPQLVVSTAYPDVAPAEVARFVTEPIEQAVSTVPGVLHVESSSREGISLVTLRFSWGTDMDFAVLGVREKLDNLAGGLPERADRPAVLRTDPRSEPILAVTVAGGGGDLAALEALARSVVKRRLEQIDGVAQAAVTGGLEREVHVAVDPAALESHGLSIGDVSAAIDAANASAPGGTILRGRFRYPLRTSGELAGAGEIRAVALPGDDSAGGALTVGDVASVEDGFRERESIVRYDGREAVALLVFKESGANTARVAARVDAVLAQLRREYPRVRLAVASSQAGFIRAAIGTVEQQVVFGGLLAFLVLFLFLGDVRYPLAIATAIPLSVLAAFSLLDAAGATLNLMTLGGLALGIGMLVDNAIVVVENVVRHRESGRPAGVAAVLGADEVQRAVLASTLTTVAVFGPIIYVQGVAGRLFGALSLSVAFSLLASVLVAFTVVPALAARWAAAGDGSRALVFAAVDRGYARFAAAYERVLDAALRRRARTLAAAALLLGLGALAGFALPRSVLPRVDQGAFRVRIERPRGSTLEATSEEAARVEAALRRDGDVASVLARIGRQAAVAGSDETSGLNTAVLDVRLRPGRATAPVVRRLRARLRGLPPGEVDVEQGQATSLGMLLGAGNADIAVRVRGEDLDGSLAYARRVEDRLAHLGDVTNVRLGTELGQPEIEIGVDREAAAAYGIEPSRVADAVADYTRGRVATRLVDFDRKVPVLVRLPAADRRSAEALGLLRVAGVPLRELVRSRTRLGPAEVRRANQAQVVPVLADVARGGLDHAVREIRQALTGLDPPAGVQVEVGGANEEMRRAFRGLAFAFAVAMLLVYMILAAEFESFLQPVIMLLSVPLALVGAFLTLWISGAGLNSVSLIGLVVLAGIAENDAVVKIDFINRLRREGMPLREAIHAAGRARLRPIVLTSVTTMLGVLPMALGIGAGAGLQAPLAIALFGGLVTSTTLTLIVVPVVYEVVESARAPKAQEEYVQHAGAGEPANTAVRAGSFSSGR